MERCEGPHNGFTIALHGGLHLSNKMYHYERPHSSLTIDLHGGLCLAIIMDR
jgi:hypothetical protein